MKIYIIGHENQDEKAASTTKLKAQRLAVKVFNKEIKDGKYHDDPWTLAAVKEYSFCEIAEFEP